MNIPNLKELTVASGTTVTLSGIGAEQIVTLNGTVDLAGNYVLQTDANIKNPSVIYVVNMAALTTSGGNLTLFGTNIDSSFLSLKFIATCIYTGSWKVYLSFDAIVKNTLDGSFILNASITGAKLVDDAVTLAKLYAITRGSIIVGGAADAPTLLDAKTSAALLGGDGTDVKSLAIDATTGDIGGTVAGGKLALTVGNAKIDENKIISTAIGGGLLGGSGTTIKVNPNTIDGTSIEADANGTRLTGDQNAPGINKVYGTDSAGNKGWKTDPTTGLEASLSIGTAAVLTLNSTPLEIIAPPGAGKAIVVEEAFMYLTYNSAAYNTNTNLQLITDTAEVQQFTSTAILAAGKSVGVKLTPYSVTDKTQIIANKGLRVKVETGNPATGDSGIKVYVKYRIVTL